MQKLMMNLELLWSLTRKSNDDEGYGIKDES